MIKKEQLKKGTKLVLIQKEGYEELNIGEVFEVIGDIKSSPCPGIRRLSDGTEDYCIPTDSGQDDKYLKCFKLAQPETLKELINGF